MKSLIGDAPSVTAVAATVNEEKPAPVSAAPDVTPAPRPSAKLALVDEIFEFSLAPKVCCWPSLTNYCRHQNVPKKRRRLVKPPQLLQLHLQHQ